jgi:hypothetical protein
MEQVHGVRYSVFEEERMLMRHLPVCKTNATTAKQNTRLRKTRNRERQLQGRWVGKHEVANIRDIDGQKVECVGQFKYLGTLITSEGSCTTEIRKRIGVASAQLRKVTKIFDARDINARLKIRLLQALIMSILLYNCEV